MASAVSVFPHPGFPHRSPMGPLPLPTTMSSNGWESVECCCTSAWTSSLCFLPRTSSRKGSSDQVISSNLSREGGSWTWTATWSGFSHALVGKRGVCWHKDGDARLLLQVDTSCRTQSPPVSSNSSWKNKFPHCVTPLRTHLRQPTRPYSTRPTFFPHQLKLSEMWIVPQSYATSMSSWRPVGCLVWSTRYTSQVWCPGNVGEQTHLVVYFSQDVLGERALKRWRIRRPTLYSAALSVGGCGIARLL